MLKFIVHDIAVKLAQHGVSHVYSAFDAVDIQKKTNSIFTVIDIKSYESSTPVYSLSKVYIPFKAEVSLRVTAPESWSMDRLYDYFDEYIAPAVNTMSNLNCSLKGVTLRHDSNISRLVLNAVISTGGIVTYERNVS